MVSLGRVEMFQGSQFRHNRSGEHSGLIYFLNNHPGDVVLFLRMGEDYRTVLRADIVALTIGCGRIVD